MKWKFFFRKMKYAYQIQNVPNRSGIFFHSGNYFFNIKGCILLGDKYGNLNNDGQTDILNTVATIKKFEDLMKKKDFKLRII